MPRATLHPPGSAGQPEPRAVHHGELIGKVVVPEWAQDQAIGFKRRAGHHPFSLPPGQQGDSRTPLVPQISGAETTGSSGGDLCSALWGAVDEPPGEWDPHRRAAARAVAGSEGGKPCPCT